ncbi:MAG: acyltransferase [Armatimonas sp.]
MSTDTAPPTRRNLPLGYLRAFVTLLVLAHHTVIAYLPDVPPLTSSLSKLPLAWSGFPVVDSHKWAPFGLLVFVNDLFFMSLMFFLSGLFVWNSLQRKGATRFLRDRVWRLGLPFFVSALVLAPLAYYPTYRLTGAEPGLLAYAKTWAQLPYWPAGPAWFLWVLLLFSGIAALLHRFWPTGVTRFSALLGQQPGRFFAGLMLIGALVYIPSTIVVPFSEWVSYGPFTVQGSRFLHYGLYFFSGVAVGTQDLESGLLASTGKLARQSTLWGALSAVGCVAMLSFMGIALSIKGMPRYALEITGGLLFEFACTALCFSLLALFLKKARQPNPTFEVLTPNAYGMYLTHYVFNTWLQYALLPIALPGIVKGLCVFLGVVITSGLTTALLRRISFLKRIL